MIRLEEATKKYNVNANEIVALNQASLSIETGEMVAVMGPSGCGKTSLLNILGGMDKLSSGKYFFDGKEISKYGLHKLHQFRKENIGFVFQNFALINRCTVYENMEIPLIARNQKHYKNKIMDCLEMLGIAECAKRYPQKLSGGQQQRLAIGRMLITDCHLLLCDEPTGALDSKTSEEIMRVLRDANKSGKTVIIATHNEKVADHCSRRVCMIDGSLREGDTLTEGAE